MKNVLFIHRSVGRNLIGDGSLYSHVEGKNFSLSDFDHNKAELYDGTNAKKLDIQFEGGNTKPENYAQLFSQEGRQSQKKALDLILGYDVVVIKSCYPNSNISSDKELKQIKEYYSSISGFFRELPDKKLIIMTSPPLVPFLTYSAAAERARTLANWLAETNFGDNVFIFNFFNELAGDDNMLKEDYRRWLFFDAHPNKRASQDIAPKLVDFISSKVS